MSSDANGLAWPADLLDASEVRDWIGVVLPGRPAVGGPVEIYREKGWGVTARFTVAAPKAAPPRQEAPHQWPAGGVVFKASALPLFAHSPAVGEMLNRQVPAATPQQLAHDWRHGQTWTLFAPFGGRGLPEPPALGDLLDLARAMASIQERVAALAPAETALLPRLPVAALPALFDGILADVRGRHLAAWQEDDRATARRFALPADPLAALAGYRARVAAWADELRSGPWPESIDHVDLRAGYAVRLPDGQVLIYDWEEAQISCPFFSLDRLLDDARRFDRGRAGGLSADSLADGANLMFGGTALTGSPSERAVRRAYLDAVPWGGRAQRERAFDLALGLAPLKFAHECMVFTQAQGWDEWGSALAAFCLSRALQRWRSLDARYPGA